MPVRAPVSRSRTAAALVTLALVAGMTAGCSSDGPDSTLKDFLAGWHSGDLSAVGFVAANGSKIASADVTTQLRQLSGDLAKQPPTVATVGDPTTKGDNATSAVKVDWTLPGGALWSYQSTVRLTRQGSTGWRVIWEPAIVQPDLASGEQLKIRRTAAKRGGILDAKGQPIVTPHEVVTIGVTPEKITKLAPLRKDLAAAFAKINVSIDLSTLADRVENADDGAFIELITLRRTDYDKIRDSVRNLPGTVFRTEQRDLAPTRVFARALLGTVDVATREDIDARPDLIAQGDMVGHGGLQQKYDAVLRGTPGVSVVISRESAEGKVDQTKLFGTDPVPGKPVATTLDVTAQNAADAAVATQKQPSSLVAIKISDGSVLAVANGPDGPAVNTALTGQVPPGSTFKTVTAYGVLARKLVQPNTVVDCPKQAVVSGRKFRNAHKEAFGKVPFHVDYAKSCNTAFVGLAPKLGADGLHEAATALGLGGQWDLGIGAFSGTVSAAGSPTELAAAAFGQGATVVSPLAMASVSAAVARGQFKQPRLVLDPAPAKPAADGPQLDATAVGQLRQMMREVVTGGTATALRGVPGKPVHGKTGTAEFDEKSKDTHSWFIGFQGDVAFAVMVQKGGAGAEAAVPLVKQFLTTVNK